MRPNNFDLIRLLAAIQVVIYHGVEHLKIEGLKDTWLLFILECFPGVPIFFVLSGFLVSASWERSKSLGQYVLNRALRIFPGLWCCFAFSIVVVLCLMPGCFANASVTNLGTWIIAQLTMFQFYNPEFLRPFGVGALNGSLWTIPIELQFYIVLPIVYAVFKRKDSKLNLAWLVPIFLIFMAANQVLFVGLTGHREEMWYKLISVSMLPHFWLFLLGVVLQQHFDSIKHLFTGKLHYWLIVHAIMIYIAWSLGRPTGTNYPFPGVALTLAGTTLAFGFTGRQWADKLLNHNDISYGVYIYHMIVANAFIHLKFTGTYSSLACLLLTTIVLATLSWRFIERPCINLKKRWQTKTPANSASIQATN